MIEPRTVIKRTANQVSCSLNGEVAILNLGSARYFGVDSVGAYIWHELQEPRSVAALCKAVIENFDVPEAICESDVVKFVIALREAKLVELVEEQR